MKEFVRWGILGTASIARRQAIPAMRSSPYARAQAIASRSPERARQLALENGIPRAYGSYQELVEADDVDAVYIPLPNHLHLAWIERAAAAGKHVLCEKPLGLGATQVQQVQEIASRFGVQVMEGISSLFHPVHHEAARWIREGRIGDVVVVRASLGWSLENPSDYRWRAELGGGALLDLGGYLVATARLLTGEEPLAVVARSMLGTGGADVNTSIMLSFATATALLDCGLASASRNGYEIIGSRGRIVVDHPFGNRTPSRTIRWFDAKGTLKHEERFEGNQFQREIDAVSEALLRGAPLPIPLAESLKIARVLDACRASAITGGPVAISPLPAS